MIVSRGSLEAPREALRMAKEDYRDLLAGEGTDPWLMGELRRYGRPYPED